MATTYLVDSVAVSDMMDGVESIRALAQNAEILIPMIVPGELYFAYENDSRKEENYERFYALSKDWKTLNVTAQTARIYASIQLELKRKGQMIPLNDLWIAALAVEHDFPLLSRDTHFQPIDALTVVDWAR